MTRPLRIFQVFEASANAMLPTNRTWYRNLHEPLLDLGHDVFLYPAEPGRRALWENDSALRTRFSEALYATFLAQHRKAPFDLFFAYLVDGMVDAAVIDRVREQGVATSNFSCNNVHQFGLVSGHARQYDFSLHAEKAVAEKFRSVGANPIWWPMAANPNYFRPQPVERDVTVSFVGANYGVRARYVQRLLEAGIPVFVAGPGWQWGARTPLRSRLLRGYLLGRAALAVSSNSQARWSSELAEHDVRRRFGAQFPGAAHPPVSDDELIALYSRSEITLGILDVFMNHDPSGPIVRHLHLRDFEAPMSGALYCTGYMEELSEFFEPDREVIVYRDAEEMVEKVQYYLDRPTAADAIRLAGYKRALADHTYHKRFNQLFRTIGLHS